MVLRQHRNSVSVIIVELHRRRIEIGFLTFAALSLRNNGDPVLFQKPRKSNLGSSRAMLDADSLKYGAEVHITRGPMHRVQVDIVDTELSEAGVQRAPEGLRREVLVPYLGRQMQLLPCETRRGNGGAYSFLVLIHLGSVDVSISELQRALDYRLAATTRHTKRAKPEAWQFNSLCLQSFPLMRSQAGSGLQRKPPQR